LAAAAEPANRADSDDHAASKIEGRGGSISDRSCLEQQWTPDDSWTLLRSLTLSARPEAMKCSPSPHLG